MPALLRFWEIANAMKILDRRRPLDRVKQGWLCSMSEWFRFACLASRLQHMWQHYNAQQTLVAAHLARLTNVAEIFFGNALLTRRSSDIRWLSRRNLGRGNTSVAPSIARSTTAAADCNRVVDRVTTIITTVTRCDGCETRWQRGRSLIVTGDEFIFRWPTPRQASILHLCKEHS
jgi:hypothetical protein